MKYMSWISHLFGNEKTAVNQAEEPPKSDYGSSDVPHLSTLQKTIFEQATRLMNLVNESLALANNSTNPDTKVSRLEVARARLSELERLAQQYTFIKLQRLDGVNRSIAALTEEFAAAGYYAHASIDSLNGYQQDARRSRHAQDGDLVKGRIFCATMQLRTPLRILSRHGEKFGNSIEPPKIMKADWEGTWLAQIKTLSEILGVPGLPDFESSTMASSVGQIPTDGGEFLKFLKAVRIIVEKPLPIVDRLSALRSELKTWPEFVQRLGGRQAIYDEFFPPFLTTIPGLQKQVIESLWSAGLTTPATIMATADKRLIAVKGIGPAKLAAIRLSCQNAADPQSEHVDCVWL